MFCDSLFYGGRRRRRELDPPRRRLDLHTGRAAPCRQRASCHTAHISDWLGANFARTFASLPRGLRRVYGCSRRLFRRACQRYSTGGGARAACRNPGPGLAVPTRVPGWHAGAGPCSGNNSRRVPSEPICREGRVSGPSFATDTHAAHAARRRAHLLPERAAVCFPSPLGIIEVIFFVSRAPLLDRRSGSSSTEGASVVTERLAAVGWRLPLAPPSRRQTSCKWVQVCQERGAAGRQARQAFPCRRRGPSLDESLED